jgi:hypothetical protein
MNSRVILLTFASTLLIATPVVAECDISLKPTDDYNVLAGKLDCLNKRIVALEKAIGPTSGPSMARSPLGNGTSVKGGKLIGAIKECGWSKDNGNLFCSFLIDNKTPDDQKFCLSSEARVVTDSSAAFSKALGYYAAIGSKMQSVGWNTTGDVVCDELPPLTRVEAWVRFNDSKGTAKERVQFVRLDCGADCKVDAYDVEIK